MQTSKEEEKWRETHLRILGRAPSDPTVAADNSEGIWALKQLRMIEWGSEGQRIGEIEEP